MESYFITPELLRDHALRAYPSDDLFAEEARAAIEETLAEVLTEMVFDGSADDYRAWQQSPADAARLVWEAKSERRKLSTLAEEFFRRLAARLGMPMLLRKGELHRLVAGATLTPATQTEVRAKLDLLAELFESARGHDEVPEVVKDP